mgnify:CR=1 FL=1
MNYNLKIIGGRIKTQRKELGLSQDALSEMLNCDRGVLGKYEKGERLPPLDLLLYMCDKFDCDLGYLLGEYEEKTRVNADICKETGLDEEAIIFLKKMLSYKIGDAFSPPVDAENENPPIGMVTCEYDKPIYLINLIFNNSIIIGLIMSYLCMTNNDNSSVYQGDRGTAILFELMVVLRNLRDKFQLVYKPASEQYFIKKISEEGGAENGEHTGKTE